VNAWLFVSHLVFSSFDLDREDHTFCGIMFPVKCKDLLPLDHVVIHSVAVRGRLGPLTVWVSKEETNPRRGFRMNSKFWEKIYERTHGPSIRDYVELDLRSNPIYLKPGQTRAIYIHSTLPGDEGKQCNVLSTFDKCWCMFLVDTTRFMYSIYTMKVSNVM
jgi:hypothetical protein